MKKRFKSKIRLLSLIVALALIFSLCPATVMADDIFPGKPEGMSVSGTEIEKHHGNEIWLCPNSGGSIACTESKEGYLIYEAYPNGGYSFSHWATYFVCTDLLCGFEASSPVFTSEGIYSFSSVSDSGSKHNLYDKQMRVNLSEEHNGRYYLYAVFVPGINVSVRVNGTGASFSAKNLGHYIPEAGDYEYYVNEATSADFGVASGSKISISFSTDYYTSFDKVYIDGIDKTEEHPIAQAGSREYITLRYEAVTKPVKVEVTTKPREISIAFDGNGSTGGKMEPQSFEAQVLKKLPENQFERNGYIFTGWNTEPDGNGTAYADKSEATFKKDTTLYAQWAPDIMPPSAKNLTYSGQEQQLVTAGGSNYWNFEYRMNMNSSWSPVIPTAEAAGTYNVYYRATDPAGQSIESEAYKLAATIAPADLKITAKDCTTTYGSEPANEGVTYEGFVNDENEKELNGTLSYTYGEYVAGKPIGEYSIWPEGLSSGNYDIEFVPGKLVVKKRPLVVTWSNNEFTYDGTQHNPEAFLNGIYGTDMVYPKLSDPQINAGTYEATVTLTGADALMYELTGETSYTFVINKIENLSVPQVSAAAESVFEKADGKLTNVDDTMEYRAEGEAAYTPVPDGATEVAGLSAGKYYVRYKATENYNASADAEVEIAAGEKPEVIPVEDPDDEDLPQEKAEKDDSAKTGDEYTAAPFAAVMLLAMIVIVAVINRRENLN